MLFEDIAVGQQLPPVAKGPMSAAHLVRWSASMENWHRIHYDWRFATEHDKLPDLLVSGSWKQHVLIELLTSWAGETGWLHKLKFEFRGMTTVGAVLTAWGRVSSTESRGRFGIANVDIGLKDQDGVESSPGSAIVVVQRRGGPPIPYPFDPAALDGDLQVSGHR